ncbi:STAS domain-containing protein [Treponema brennaborense]|uniref:Sulfate transporter/antisigma-factor antagonist STAS n=1 Tax=Treponema brennaborense (strain DSM 12168 / CIP 105900 / DD5/3) TaxID=906968 RepID=F4LN95_TREBD|nr:STAS domain-containing protein [Treponema brennaborense]AEE16860.1 Sulfate transporter/antisigma-factor antagonist STAS [Treponema brennaborense DSM 12168]
MEQLKIQEKRGANYALLEVSGVIDSYSFTEFQQKAYALIKETNLVLDLSEVVSIDSSGLSVILGAFNDAEQFNHTLYIMRPSNGAQKAIDSTGFTDDFHIIHTVTEVL